MTYLSPLEYLYKWSDENSDLVYLREPIAGQYRELTWKQTADQVRQMAAYLKSLELPEKSKIAILSKNCSHWIITDLAIMMAGHISVPLYPNLTAETLNKILIHSEAKLIFVGKLDDFEVMEPGIPQDMPCVSFPYYPRDKHLQWDDLVEGVNPIVENVVRDPQDTATIIYTSGTTGMPKGVMHSFHNISFVLEYFSTKKGLNMEMGQRFFSYLPMCHIAEKMLIEMGSLKVRGVVSFAESLDTFTQNLKDAKATVFLAVPRIWTKFEQGILAKMPLKKLNRLLSIPILSSVVRKKIKTGLGLENAKHVFVGAAPSPPKQLEFFAKLGIHIQEAYAMTENCCYSHANFPGKIQIGSVGQPFPHCDVRLSEEGEIQVKHEAIMTGYYKEPEMTKETITEDGYLRTGDKGEIDGQGYLRITGRVKDLFKSSKGKYIAPSPIELMLSENQYLEQVCVVGNGMPQPLAICVKSEIAPNEEEFRNSLKDLLDSVNSRLDHHEKIARIIVVDEEWTVENGMVTPTLKVKRNEIDNAYGPHYEEWSNMADLDVVIV